MNKAALQFKILSPHRSCLIYTTNCCRACYAGTNAQLILKNLYRSEKTLSGTWFCELLSDWSKTLFGSQDLVSGHKVNKSVLIYTTLLGQ